MPCRLFGASRESRFRQAACFLLSRESHLRQGVCFRGIPSGACSPTLGPPGTPAAVRRRRREGLCGRIDLMLLRGKHVPSEEGSFQEIDQADLHRVHLTRDRRDLHRQEN